jgi:hypothetical protein
MNQKTFNFILDLVRNRLYEDVAPTNSVSAGGISGLGDNEGDHPPVDLRRKKYKNLPGQYRELFRRKKK